MILNAQVLFSELPTEMKLKKAYGEPLHDKARKRRKAQLTLTLNSFRFSGINVFLFFLFLETVSVQ